MKEFPIVKIIPALFIMYLSIGSNFTGEIFNCKVIYQASRNFIFKHIIAFLILFFSIVLTTDFMGKDELDNKFNSMSPLYKFCVSIVVYIFFLITTRCDFKYMFVIFILITIIFIVELQHKYLHDTNNNSEKMDYILNSIKNGGAIIACLLTIVGFMVYLGKKKEEYGKNWNWLKFIFGRYDTAKNTACKFNQQGRYRKKNDFKYIKKGFK